MAPPRQPPPDPDREERPELDETESLPPPAAVRERRVDEVAARRPRPPLLWPALLLLLLLVLGGLGALVYFTREDEREVPSVVGLPLEDAVERVTDEGFESDLRRAANQAPRETVFRQRPPAGSEADEGSTVTLVVSSGPARTAVPSVVGLPLARALEQLDGAGLGARQRRIFSEEPPDVVVAQAPAGGERVARGSAVRINVSRGTGTVDVPDVVGQTSDDAGANIRKAGLEARAVETPSDESEGTVLSQNPSAGSEARRGTTVRINVSAGAAPGTTTTGTTTATTGADEGTTTAPTETEAGTTGAAGGGTVTVPTVVGFSGEVAASDLAREGLQVAVETQPTTDQFQVGIVIDQRPAAGRRVRPGSTVTLVVGELG